MQVGEGENCYPKLNHCSECYTTKKMFEWRRDHQKENLFVEFEEYAKKEEIVWRQRSTVLWLKQGGMNTKFLANSHMRNNNIDKLWVEREIIEELGKIESEIIAFYQRLHSETEEWRPSCSMNNCPSISEKETYLANSFWGGSFGVSETLCSGHPWADGYTVRFFIKF